MTDDEFRRLTHSGHGRAVVYAAEHDVECFRDIIVDLCLHCRAYDPMFDGTHAAYALTLLDQIPAREDYYKLVLEALPESGDDYDAVHRFHIAVCLAMEGDTDAKRAVYDHYNPGPERGVHIALDFVNIDGLNGLLFVAGKLGGLMQTSNPELDVDWLVSRSIEQLGESEVRAALIEASASDPRVDAFRLAVENSIRRKKRTLEGASAIRASTYVELKPSLPKFNRGQLLRWGRSAPTAELELAARGLIESGERDEQLRHLWIFLDASFPLEPHFLIELVDSADVILARAAAAVLANVQHPAVRDLAMRLMRRHHPHRAYAVDLLARNFEAGDPDTVLTWFEQEEDIDVQHQMDLFEFWKKHPHVDSEVRMLNLVYEITPCTLCRECAVARLIELNALTDQMRIECAYDSSEGTRKLVELGHVAD